MSSLESFVQSHAAYCREQLDRLSHSLEKYPPGKLHHYRNGKYNRFVIISKGGTTVNVRSKDNSLKRKMAWKILWEARQKDLQAELAACEACLQVLEHHPHAEEQLLSDPHISELLSTEAAEADIQAWMDEPYPRSQKYPEHLIVPSAAGFPVRSKSEAMIISILLDLEIPFRYEQEYTFNGIPMSPDFTLLHPRTRKTCLLEHFGLMDNPEYANQAAEKLRIYVANGCRPQDTLLFFFEYSERPLDVNYVRSELARWMQ